MFAWLLVPNEHNSPNYQIQFDPGSRGSAQFLMQAAMNQDPCLRVLAQQAVGSTATLRSDDNLMTVPAQVTTAEIGTDDNLGVHVPTETGVYTQYRIAQKTHLDPQVLVIPVGASGRGPSVCRYGEAVAYRIVEWLASRYGAPPVVPDPKPLDPNLVLLGAQIEAMNLEAAADGQTPRYSVSGRYVYTYRDPKQAVINAAVPPWMKPEYVKDNSVSLFPFGFSQGLANYNNIAGPIIGSVDGKTYTKDGGVGALNGPTPGGIGGGTGDF
jgi:hypothetical protein